VEAFWCGSGCSPGMRKKPARSGDLLDDGSRGVRTVATVIKKNAFTIRNQHAAYLPHGRGSELRPLNPKDLPSRARRQAVAKGRRSASCWNPSPFVRTAGARLICNL
jgi:hypothetical protein